MSVAFLGTSEFGADVLEALVRAGVEIEVAISQPDRPSGRGRRLQPPPVAVRAGQLGLPLVQTERASDQAVGAPAGVVVGFGQLIRDPLLHALPLFNLHPSLLPRWRGAAPVERAIMAGDAETGVAVIGLVAELDAGPVHGMARFAIGPHDDAGTVRARALALGVPLLLEALAGHTTGRPQSESGVVYAHKLTADDRRIDWHRGAVEIDRQVRALAPHIGARTELDGRPVVVWRAQPVDAAAGVGQVRPPLVVGCGQGALDVLELQPAGGRRMARDDYLRGLRAPPARAG